MKRGRKTIGSAKKTVQVTIRMEPKIKFALDLIVSQTGIGITPFMDDAVRRGAKELPLAKKWSELWDEHEGVRKLNELACKGYKMSDDDEELAEFIRAHAKAFSGRERIVALWPHLAHYREAWRESPAKSRKLIAAALKSET